jgi:phosphoenolpyruvate carboxylase
MVETLLTLVEAVTTSYDVYKCLSSIKSGKEVDKYLQQMATEMTELRVQVERLSDTLLYAVNLDGANTVHQSQQQYVNDLRQIRESLEPIQQRIQQPLLASAMKVTTPPPELTQQLRQKLDLLMPLRIYHDSRKHTG